MEKQTRFRPGLQRLGVGCASALSVLAITQLAAAADCPTDLPNPIYGTGGSAFTPAIAQIAAKLAGNITVFWADPSGCNAINAFAQSGYTITGSTSYWTSAGTQVTCTLPTAGVPADFGNVNVDPTSCAGITKVPDGVGDFIGPAQSTNLIVNKASDYTSISAEAAYFVFGFGGAAGQVAPWTNDANVFVRSGLSAVHLLVSKAIGVPPTAFKGTLLTSNGQTVSAVSAGSFPNPPTGFVFDPLASIGYVSAQNADLNRATLKTLAYQHTGQDCGYWPDSTPEAFDKINVRDGRYYIWSYNHFLAKVDSNGEIINPNVRKFVGYITGAETPPAGLDPKAIIVSTYNIPLCAMHVKRDYDLGPLQCYAPPEPCDCQFEKLATGTTACTACETEGSKAECAEVGAKSTCRNGYCEAY
jgi:hypothetical protein